MPLLWQPVHCTHQPGALQLHSPPFYPVALSFSQRRIITYFSHRTLCRQQSTPGRCFCSKMLGPGTYLLNAMYHHILPLLLSESKWKASQLCLTQRTVPGQQACLELAPGTCGNFYLHHIQGLLSFPKCKAPSDQHVLFTVLLSSKFHRAHHSLTRAKNVERHLVQKNVPGQNHVLHVPFASPRLWCCIESPGHRTTNPASASLLAHFAE